MISGVIEGVAVGVSVCGLVAVGVGEGVVIVVFFVTPHCTFTVPTFLVFFLYFSLTVIFSEPGLRAFKTPVLEIFTIFF